MVRCTIKAVANIWLSLQMEGNIMGKSKEKKKSLFKTLIIYTGWTVIGFLLFVVLPGKIAGKNLGNVFEK